MPLPSKSIQPASMGLPAAREVQVGPGEGEGRVRPILSPGTLRDGGGAHRWESGNGAHHFWASRTPTAAGKKQVILKLALRGKDDGAVQMLPLPKCGGSRIKVTEVSKASFCTAPARMLLGDERGLCWIPGGPRTRTGPSE